MDVPPVLMMLMISANAELNRREDTWPKKSEPGFTRGAFAGDVGSLRGQCSFQQVGYSQVTARRWL
jgi:hypothetical protein